ncbi:MAG: DUF5009 domain-containing protein [Phycisphaerae bacterium]|nr:DUF5009 domain-containing protein [Phycisphaerae bacterium]
MEPNTPVSASGRLMSIDALRGFDMFWIIGGERMVRGLDAGLKSPWFSDHVTRQMGHVPWEGFQFMDLIMPLFLFISGVAMPFSFAKRLGSGHDQRGLYAHVAKRFAILFVLGMVAQGNLLAYDLSKLHIFCNTLQAIAAGYLIAALCLINLRLVGQIAVAVGLLLGFWALMAWVPVPGHGAGKLTPDGNLAIWLDHRILGAFQDRTTYSWILSSMTFGCTVLLGAFAGQLLRSSLRSWLKAMVLLIAGGACFLVGLGWNPWFPIIKHLWTSSFVLYSGGMSLALMGLFYLLIDVWGLRRWAFVFMVIGMNAIAVYMANMLFDFRRIADIFVGGLGKWTGSWQDLIRAAGGFAVVWLILLYMYRKKTFVKV